MNKLKQIRIPAVLIICIGGVLISNNKLENARTVDIIQLIVLGILLGILIANLREVFRKKD